jgi:hypothetical protein
VLSSTALRSHTDDDRLSLEPYRVATAMPRGVDGKASVEAVAAVAEGRARQDRLAAEGLRDLLDGLARSGRRPLVAALLVNRVDWVTDRLDFSLAWPEHVAIAELLAVRDALRAAFLECAIASVELDEKSLPDVAAEALDHSPEDIDGVLKELGRSAGKPWRKEQKLACLAAWYALARER